MEIEYFNEKSILTVKFTEDIDQHIADKLRRKMDDEIEKYIPKKVIFDFSSISFMDSSGIGMILGRYKLVKMLGGNIELINVNKSIKKIFEMSGVTRIILIKSILEENLENNLENDLEKEIKEEDKNNEGII